MNRGGHFNRVTMSPDMQIEGRRGCAEQVIMNRRDFEAAIDQFRHDRIDLGLKKDQIAHGHDAVMCWLQCNPTAERKRGRDRDPIKGYLEVTPGKAVAMNVAGYCGLPAECGIYLLPIDILGISEGGGCQDETTKQS